MLYRFVDERNFAARQMTFTKSFGYALRGVLYIALNSHDKPKQRVGEIASRLQVPKDFLGKIMKKLVQTGILNSTKGPHGGFSLNNRTLCTSLLELATITNSISKVDDCVLRFDKCDSSHPCPLHHKMLHYRKDLYNLLATTSIGELLNQGPADYIKSIHPSQAT
ncbi:MAG TPA: Rrf2 family transcriptional regulator [Flavitalea sp.]|nr:Rrf2 family transcriptional regulator [Flavitalea sp.]